MKPPRFFAHATALVESTSIGSGTRIWAYAHVLKGARIGRDCNLGDHAFVEGGAVIGHRVTIKNGVMIWNGVVLENDVFVSPAAVFTNDLRPRSPRGAAVKRRYHSKKWLVPTRISAGASIGANATIVCGVTIGKFAMIGMSAFLAIRQNFFVGALPGTAYLLLLSATPLSFWIWSELRCARPRTLGRVLCRGGHWSYSLYIVHPVAYILWDKFHPGFEAHSIAYLGGAILLMLAASYIFFLLIEGPSVRLAKLASNRFAPCPRRPSVEMSA